MAKSTSLVIDNVPSRMPIIFLVLSILLSLLIPVLLPFVGLILIAIGFTLLSSNRNDQNLQRIAKIYLIIGSTLIVFVLMVGSLLVSVPIEFDPIVISTNVSP